MDQIPTDQIPTQDHVPQTPPSDFQEEHSLVGKFKLRLTKLTERPVLLAVVAGIIVLSSIVGVFAYRGYQLKKQAEQSERVVEVPTPTPTTPPSTTPTPTSSTPPGATPMPTIPPSATITPTKKDPNSSVGVRFGLYIPSDWEALVSNQTKEHFSARFFAPNSDRAFSYVDMEIIPQNESGVHPLLKVETSNTQKINGLDVEWSQGKEDFLDSKRLMEQVMIKAPDETLSMILFRKPSDVDIKNSFDSIVQSVVRLGAAAPTGWTLFTQNQTIDLWYAKFRDGSEKAITSYEMVNAGFYKVGEEDLVVFAQFINPVEVVDNETINYFFEFSRETHPREVVMYVTTRGRDYQDEDLVEKKMPTLSPSKVLIEPVGVDFFSKYRTILICFIDHFKPANQTQCPIEFMTKETES